MGSSFASGRLTGLLSWGSPDSTRLGTSNAPGSNTERPGDTAATPRNEHRSPKRREELLRFLAAYRAVEGFTKKEPEHEPSGTPALARGAPAHERAGSRPRGIWVFGAVCARLVRCGAQRCFGSGRRHRSDGRREKNCHSSAELGFSFWMNIGTSWSSQTRPWTRTYAGVGPESSGGV